MTRFPSLLVERYSRFRRLRTFPPRNFFFCLQHGEHTACYPTSHIFRRSRRVPLRPCPFIGTQTPSALARATSYGALRRLLGRRPIPLSHTALLVVLGVPLRAIAGNDTSMFSPVSTPGHAIARLGLFVLLLALGIFATLSILTTYILVRYRAKAEDAHLEPPQIFGSTEIELAWTIIPILIIVVLFLTTAGVLFGLQHESKPANALDVVAIGHQFWWEYRYPSLGVVTANELHLPVSDAQERPVFIKLTSSDVIHSFWIPRISGKVDLIPNRVNELWLDPRVPGLYLGQCAQFCGPEHARMLLRVYVETPQQFDAWVRNQQKNGAEDPGVAAGRQAFESQACINCHRVSGTVADGQFGPDLTHLMSRETIASGAVVNNRENLRRWIENPDSFKAGCLMPSMHLDSQQLDQITTYLMSLK